MLQRLHARVRSLTDQGLVFHCSKALTLLTVFTNDMYIVRFSLIAASSLSMVFHFVFPDPRPIRMFYGLLFAVGHAVAVFFYWYERSDHWEIRNVEDQAVYDKHFRPMGVTKHHFLEMRKISRYVDVPAGTLYHQQNGSMEYLSLILSGTVQTYRIMGPEDRKTYSTLSDEAYERFRASQASFGMPLSSLYEGCWIGEVYDPKWDPDIPHYWFSTVKAVSDLRLLQFDKGPLHRYFSKGHKADNVESAALTIQVKDLWTTRRYNSAHNASKIAELEKRLSRYEEV